MTDLPTKLAHALVQELALLQPHLQVPDRFQICHCQLQVKRMLVVEVDEVVEAVVAPVDKDEVEAEVAAEERGVKG